MYLVKLLKFHRWLLSKSLWGLLLLVLFLVNYRSQSLNKEEWKNPDIWNIVLISKWHINTCLNRSKKLIFKDSIEKEISTICTFGSMESFEFVNGSFKVKLISLQSGVVKLSLLTNFIFLLRYVDILQTLVENKRGSIHLQKWISANCQPGILINTCLYTCTYVPPLVLAFRSR